MKDEEWEEAHGGDGMDEMDGGRGWDGHGRTRTGTDGAEGRED